MCDAILNDLSNVPRKQRQLLYAYILKRTGIAMTPTEVKEELERTGMTFEYVGQDMSPMRTLPFISSPTRGKYAWNTHYNNDMVDLSLCFPNSKESKEKEMALQNMEMLLAII